MRKCNCSGNCGPQTDGLTRREFIELAAAGTAGALLTNPALGAAFELPPEELQKWTRELFAPSKPRVYVSGQHTDARMHLGGIGTGNFEIGVDGQFTNWQLFNTLRDGYVPLHFGVKAGGVARLLQTAGGPTAPRVRQIEMVGEYPLARLRFLDPALPVQLELEAFSPFAPLDTRISSMPLACFVFRIHNPTAQGQTVSLAELMMNPIGYDAADRLERITHPTLGGNVNEFFRESHATGLLLRAEAGKEPTLDKPVLICVPPNLRGLQAPPPDHPDNLKIEVLDRQPLDVKNLPNPTHTILWLEDVPSDISLSFLRSARDAVLAGATLLFSGQTQPLLRAYAAVSGGKPLAQTSPRPDILFEDFERGYENWKVEGAAFGKGPARGTLPNQQRVSGFIGKGLVNSYLEGDDTIGRLTSKPFTVERHFIRFLVGGGHHANTQIRLFVGDRIVRAVSGKDNERLEPVTWDVREFANQTAHIEIVDEQKGGWGHVNVDHIEFSDQPANRQVMELLEELLPARFSWLRGAAPGRPEQDYFDGLEVHPETKTTTARNGLGLLIRNVGKGKVVLAAGQILDPAHAALINARQRAYVVLCDLVGANYSVTPGQSPKASGFGTLALALLQARNLKETGSAAASTTPAIAPPTGTRALDQADLTQTDVTVLPAFEDLNEAWRQFADQGRFAAPEQSKPNTPTPPGRTVYGALAAMVTVAPNATVELPFLLAWHYPNKYNAAGAWMGCHYATLWPEARAVLRETAANFATLREKTARFRRTFYDSTLPYWLLDCLTANAAIIRHAGVVFRIANGDVYAWEGSNGCCQPTCTHVWGYEQTLSRLFPDLEREMRRIDFKHQQRQDGGVNNRTDVPSPPRPTGEQPFADGHASCILKAYREALNSPDESFFGEYWPHIERAVDYLIGRDAKSHGGQPAGYLEDDQWNTYDEALHGVTTFISGYYLSALRAGEEWARRQGDTAAAERFHNVFVKGQERLVELCWNGEYFQQHLPDYMQRPGEVGPGCMSDQLIGQWWAHQLGLGYVLPKDKVVAALRSIFKYNFKSDLTGWKHMPRAFAGDKDKGLIICTWPKGGRPGHVMLYSDEVWTGIEYQVAAHMIYEGLIEEGLAIIKGARDRYDGLPRPPIGRNPWNEIECGGHYARAMSSWSLLLALSGWEYNGPRQTLRFAPRHTPDNFKGFWCGPEGWGSLRQMRDAKMQQNEIHIAEGSFAVARILLASRTTPATVLCRVGEKPCEATLRAAANGTEVSLTRPLTLKTGETLLLRLES
jgi:uncharacterized protein (DUF608 family)